MIQDLKWAFASSRIETSFGSRRISVNVGLTQTLDEIKKTAYSDQAMGETFFRKIRERSQHAARPAVPTARPISRQETVDISLAIDHALKTPGHVKMYLQEISSAVAGDPTAIRYFEALLRVKNHAGHLLNT